MDLSREEFDALVARVAALEERLTKPRRTGRPILPSHAGRPKIVLATLATRDDLTELEPDTLVLTTDTFTMWRRIEDRWVRKSLPVCDHCELQAVAAVPFGDGHVVNYGCSEHRPGLVEDFERLATRQAKWARQREQLREN